MSFVNDIQSKILIFDGSMGVMLQKNGLPKGHCPEEWNISHPEIVSEIYKAYRDAGSDIIQTNTFQSNRIKLSEYKLEDKLYQINYDAVKMAKDIMQQKGRVSASVGSLGKLLEPFGELTFDLAYDTFKEQVIALRDGGADMITLETFTDVAEMRIALLAVLENTDLPVICSMSYEKNGKTLMGTEPEICAIILSSMGATLVGTNCSFGAEHMLKIAKCYQNVGIPFSMKPNAGMPETIDGKLVYSETPESFSQYTQEFVKSGARLIGGCCGTTPLYIEAVKRAAEGLDVVQHQLNIDYITSSVRRVAFSDLSSSEIGTINITENDISEVTDEAMDLATDCDVAIISAQFEGMREGLLAEAVCEAQTYMKQPLIIKTNDAEQLNAALRIYKGRAGVIIPQGDAAILEVAQKYGAVNVGGKYIDG